MVIRTSLCLSVFNPSTLQPYYPLQPRLKKYLKILCISSPPILLNLYEMDSLTLRNERVATRLCFLIIALALLSTLTSQLSTAFAQGTAFTYQGRLANSGAAASGNYDLRFD